MAYPPVLAAEAGVFPGWVLAYAPAHLATSASELVKQRRLNMAVGLISGCSQLRSY